MTASGYTHCLDELSSSGCEFFALRVTPPAHPEPDASRMDLKSRFSKRNRRFSKRSRRFSKSSRRVSNQRSRANLTEKMSSNNFKIAKKMDAEKWPTSHQKPSKTFQNRTQNPPKPRVMRDIFRAMDVGTAKKPKKNIDPTKKRAVSHSTPPF